MFTLKVTTIGKSDGVVLPRELLERLRVQKGDRLYAVETPDGVTLASYNPEFAVQMAAAERVLSEDRDGLWNLAD